VVAVVVMVVVVMVVVERLLALYCMTQVVQHWSCVGGARGRTNDHRASWDAEHRLLAQYLLASVQQEVVAVPVWN